MPLSMTCTKERQGKSPGTPKRVVLDFELKKQVNRQLAKIQTIPPAERERQHREIAEAHGLKIIDRYRPLRLFCGTHE
jgi:hypothetical protein